MSFASSFSCAQFPFRGARSPAFLLAVLAAAACSKPVPPAPTATPAASTETPAAAAPLPPAVIRPMPERIVAIGDLHGDLSAARRALKLAGAIDGKDHWIGGKLVIVQTGDEIDRGDDDRAILDLFDRLSTEAAAAGGAVVALLGNHEVMNAASDFRYVTPGAFAPFATFAPGHAHDDLEPAQRPRATAFAPGGFYAKMLSNRPVTVRFGGTLFVHGGILPKHLRYGLSRMDDEAKAWLSGASGPPPRMLTAQDGPLWTRMYSEAPAPSDCATLHEMLKEAKADRLVMGHTVQRNGINAACDGAAWRIDVGMSAVYQGPIEVLEVTERGAARLQEGRK